MRARETLLLVLGGCLPSAPNFLKVSTRRTKQRPILGAALTLALKRNRLHSANNNKK